MRELAYPATDLAEAMRAVLETKEREEVVERMYRSQEGPERLTREGIRRLVEAESSGRAEPGGRGGEEG